MSKDIKENKNVKVYETQELSKTRQILWRFSKVHKDVDKKRTTFSELFFDLAVVFIFSLLAAKLMGSIGHSVSQERNDAYSTYASTIKSEVFINNRMIGIVFWVAHFSALWYTWYQFSNYTKYHWINNLGNNILTLFLIFTLILQGAGIYFANVLLSKYSLIASFIIARFIFIAAQSTAIYNSPKTKLSNDLAVKVKRQIIVTILTALISIIYIAVTASGVLDIVLVKDNNNNLLKQDSWEIDLFLSMIIYAHLLIRMVWKFIGAKQLSEETYKIVFHTKERHHLFIIIAIGELIVVTLTSSFVNNTTPTLDYETLIYMFVTPFIGMTIWYLYKAIFYKSSPVDSKKNYYLYLGTHIFLVLGLLIFLGSMKSHMAADAYGRTDTIPQAIVEIQQSSRTFYSLGIVVGMTMIITSMTIYAIFVSYVRRRWSKAVKAMTPYLIMETALIWIWLFTAIALFWLNVPVRFSTEMYTLTTFEFVTSAILVFKSQQITKTQFATVEEFDEYSASLDQ